MKIQELSVFKVVLDGGTYYVISDDVEKSIRVARDWWMQEHRDCAVQDRKVISVSFEFIVGAVKP